MGFLVGIHGESVNADHTLTTVRQQVVGVSFRAGVPSATCSYNGTALTSLGLSPSGHLRLLSLLTRFTVANGACDYVDGTQTLNVTYALSGLRSLTLFDAGSSGSGTDSDASLHVNGAPGCLAIGAIEISNDEPVAMTVPGVGSVLDYEADMLGANHGAIGHYVMQAGENDFHFEWGWAGGNDYWCSALVLVPMPAAGGVIIT